jgi:hypothetical protein
MAEINKLSKSSKLTRALTLKMRGLTVASISKLMADEGFIKVSERTLNRLLASTTAEQMADELIHQQLEDITRADVPIRLKYRDKMIERYKPSQNKIELTGNLPLQIVFSDGMKDVVKPTPTDTGKV